MKPTDRKSKIAVVVGTITNDVRVFDIPKLTVRHFSHTTHTPLTHTHKLLVELMMKTIYLLLLIAYVMTNHQDL